ncbi:AAA family ATPase [Cellulomonas shaoxiangyii]|uniref:ATP-binding protein n=1 Tax=Cellulomonas shaoxiangyii TaxID=2566013 RepID=A0A4P7SNV8_9CELL|nr:AAA family ATPase [Cellulomonas shaoxiangyii]QCB94956.1 ATP-binding protein [Cellulomonas shaoxiangyii]TGY82040.1 ATP-binding protein [Cellulomonas shaoxiangyii]
MIRTVAVEGYRSLRSLVLEPGALTVVTGGNGSGKSSLYRSLRLLQACSTGAFAATLAQEGGLASALWAGRRVREGRGPGAGPVRLRLGVQHGPGHVRGQIADDDVAFGYACEVGLPQLERTSPFVRDPEIKAETVWVGHAPRPRDVVAERRGPSVRARDADDAWVQVPAQPDPTESLLTELVDPLLAPQVLLVRESLRGWRFYDHVRTDAEAPARRGSVLTRTPVLAADGRDLAAAVATIRYLGGGAELAEVVDRAFPGSTLDVGGTDEHATVTMTQPGLLRPLSAAELSDGTLRFVLWAAALLTPRPPALMVVNEPETSLHPDLLPALAHLLAAAARRTQVVVVSHARPLVDALLADDSTPADTRHVALEKDVGETVVAGRGGLLDVPAWHWPGR